MSQQLNAFFKELADSAQAGDKHGYTELFSTDAVIFLPNRPPLRGREQIGDWFVKFQDMFVLVLDSYEQEHVSHSQHGRWMGDIRTGWLREITDQVGQS